MGRVQLYDTMHGLQAKQAVRGLAIAFGDPSANAMLARMLWLRERAERGETPPVIVFPVGRKPRARRNPWDDGPHGGDGGPYGGGEPMPTPEPEQDEETSAARRAA